jgi:hypothetical protein
VLSDFCCPGLVIIEFGVQLFGPSVVLLDVCPFEGDMVKVKVLPTNYGLGVHEEVFVASKDGIGERAIASIEEGAKGV